MPRGVITRLTTQLRESIQARSMSTAGERSALRKAFKDIDADHSGLIDLPEFCAALERFGLHTANTGLKGGSGGINDETVKALFDFFDATILAPSRTLSSRRRCCSPSGRWRLR